MLLLTIMCCAVACRAVSPAAASYLVTLNAVSGTTAQNDALVADGSYGIWSLDAEQVSIRTHAHTGGCSSCSENTRLLLLQYTVVVCSLHMTVTIYQGAAQAG
jgi:hypothetical protein